VKTTIFSLIIAIAVAVLSLFQFDRYQKFTYNTQSHFNELEKKVSTHLTDFTSDLSQLKEQEQDLLARTQHSSWKIAEAEYLVSLAATRLQTSRDVQSAIQLLTSAQEKIESLSDPNFLPIQEALSRDLTALKNVTLPNLEALWLSVSDMIAETDPLVPRNTTLEVQKKEQPANIPEPKEPDSWQQKLLKTLDYLKDLVKIRHYAKPIEPLLTEAQQTMVKEILRSLLEQIRFSILATEQKLYQQALQETKQWLMTYFENENAIVTQVQQQLDSMQDIQLRPELPEITSVSQFNAIR